ncbi:MAG: CoB--CoM heterodisulfide reductase iron-sulfur subunit A family protein [bacterium]
MYKPERDGKGILVVGGGVSGITTALEAAETGFSVTIIEKEPSLGGRVARMSQYFPKLCPPTCGLEINLRRIKSNPGITVHTLARLESIAGGPGNYTARVRMEPRYVNEKCTSCGRCADACGAEIPNDFNYGLDRRKAAYLPHEMAYPALYVLDPSIIGTGDADRCRDACAYGAIDLDMKPVTVEIPAAAVVYATGWTPYDAGKLESLSYGKHPDVITNVEMERLAAPNGPTGGKILRPSDRKEVSSVAFVQCAGSRDENHLEFCSAVCCSASLKQCTYVRENNPDARIYVFYIDIRTPGRLEDFLNRVRADEKTTLVRGKVAKVVPAPDGGALAVEAEDTATGDKTRATVDLVVLATGMKPASEGLPLPGGVSLDSNGFLPSDPGRKGIYSAGCLKRPADVASCVQDATGAALKAIQCAV